MTEQIKVGCGTATHSEGLFTQSAGLPDVATVLVALLAPGFFRVRGAGEARQGQLAMHPQGGFHESALSLWR